MGFWLGQFQKHGKEQNGIEIVNLLLLSVFFPFCLIERDLLRRLETPEAGLLMCNTEVTSEHGFLESCCEPLYI